MYFRPCWQELHLLHLQKAPPAFVKKVVDNLIARLKADHAKLQNNPALVKTIVRHNLDPYVDAQAFTRIVMGTYATNQYSSAAQRAQFVKTSVKL